MAAGDDRSRLSPGGHGAGRVNAAGAWTAVGRRDRVARAAAERRRRPDETRSSSAACSTATTSMCSRTATGRLIFASPYERDFTLIGTASVPSRAIPPSSRCRLATSPHLCDAANRYFRERIETVDVVRTLSGANMVMKPAGRLSRATAR